MPRPAYLRQSAGGGAGRGGGGEGDGAVPRPRQPSHHLLPLGLQQLGQQRECRDKLGILKRTEVSFLRLVWENT